ncbi:hypothetical protein [Actinomarinicola tropica]|uniref:Uncharacterized protein n=1 Tax=Actinomarinicola tropica TaxID=2789776 RepID=A0A5Q2RJB8_9ACTN|nr:hypothetical protein [Actinomarinicola tropica]QGG94117.1 hypothetical protein GH723_02815 [Actinomarinicola tropica]
MQEDPDRGDEDDDQEADPGGRRSCGPQPGVGAGIAAAQTDPTTLTRPPGAGAMHDGDMGAMHAQMPEDMQAQCDMMHAQGGMAGTSMNGSTMGAG